MISISLTLKYFLVSPNRCLSKLLSFMSMFQLFLNQINLYNYGIKINDHTEERWRKVSF